MTPSTRTRASRPRWWGDRPERHEAHDAWTRRERARKRHERRAAPRRERKRAERLPRGAGRCIARTRHRARTQDIKRAALTAARVVMGGPERCPTTGFPRAGDLDGSPDLYISGGRTRTSASARSCGPIRIETPGRGSGYLGRRRGGRRGRAWSCIPSRRSRTCYVGKRWMSHLDVDPKRRERSLSSAVARDRQKV